MATHTLNLNHLAKLAKLKLSTTELVNFEKDLENFLQLTHELQQVDTTDIEPMAHPLDLPQRLRDDVVTEFDQRQTLQANAPYVENGLYLVPKVINTEAT